MIFKVRKKMLQTMQNKYQKYLNNQYENLIVLSVAGSSVDIGTENKQG